MKRIYLSILPIVFAFACHAQAYTVNHFESSYDTLVDYKSLSLELAFAGESPYYWDHTFDLGFEFPFFGEEFTQVNMDSDAVGSFPDSPIFNLFFFAGSYVIGEIVDTTYLFSEVRYDYVNANNLEALVIEYHNVYVSDEYDDNGANHHINFQVWFYENGTMEVHFGDIDLTNCSYYFPGQGFSFDNSDPTDELYGPWLTMSNNDFSEGACFFGDHQDPMILYDQDDQCGLVTSIPPEGFVVQFMPSNISSVHDNQSDSSCNFRVTQHGNGEIKILGGNESFKSCTVYDYMGRKIASSFQSEFSINTIHTQMLLLHIEGDCGIEVQKMVLNSAGF